MRPIDADALKENRRGYSIKIDGLTGKWPCVLLAEIADAPTIDAVEVVRCKDCKYFRRNTNIPIGMCSKFNNVMKYADFCSHGEWREENAVD